MTNNILYRGRNGLPHCILKCLLHNDYNVNHIHVCIVRPLSNSSRNNSFFSRYEEYLEKNFPKYYTKHRLIVDGVKWSFSDFKKYFYLIYQLNVGKKNLFDLSSEDLLLLIQCKSEIFYVPLLLALLQIPIIGELIIFMAIFAPRVVLTRHFWSQEDRKNVQLAEITKCLGQHFPPICSFLESKTLRCPVRLEDLSSTRLPSLDELRFIHIFHLSRIYKVLPLKSSLLRRASELQALDYAFSKDLNSIDRLSVEDMQTNMYVRKVNFMMISPEDMRLFLRKWVVSSLSAPLNPSQYLHAPILMQSSR